MRRLGIHRYRSDIGAITTARSDGDSLDSISNGNGRGTAANGQNAQLKSAVVLLDTFLQISLDSSFLHLYYKTKSKKPNIMGGLYGKAES